MEAKAVWKGRMSFDGFSGSGFQMPIGTKPESGGDNDGFRPMELLLLGMAACTAMDVISILHKKRQEVSTFEVSVQGERAEEHPKVFTEIEVEYKVGGPNVELAAVERAVELSETKYCSAIATLGKTARIRSKVVMVEG